MFIFAGRGGEGNSWSLLFLCFNSKKVVGVVTNFGFGEGGWMGMGFRLKRVKAKKKDKMNIAKPTSYHNYSYIYKK